MLTLAVGATGETGRLLLSQLLDAGQSVRAIVRSPDKLSETVRNHEKLSLIRASVLDLTDAEQAHYVQGCDAVVSCLGHTLSVQGIYGRPRKLVTETTRRLCGAVKANQPERPVKFVLMNTAGNSNRNLQESLSLPERWTIGVIRLLLPPHAENEQAADYLRTEIGQTAREVEW